MVNVLTAERQSGYRAERDRFVALAFCWADFLIEADKNQTIVFAAGATEPALGVPPSALVGKSVDAIAAQSDRTMITQLLQVAERQGRIENVTIRLEGKNGVTPPLNLAGYCLKELGNHYFLAMRMGAATSRRGGSGAARDVESGLLSGTAFADVATERVMAIREAGQEAQVSLLAMGNLEQLRERLSEDEQDNLMRTVGATLKATSAGGDSAALIGEGKFSIVHEKSIDVHKLEQQIQALAQDADPIGQGVVVEAATIEIDEGTVSDEDIANSLLYTFNHFRDAKGEEFSLKELSSNISSLMDEAVASVNNFRQVVAASAFDVALHPIVNCTTGEIHHFEGLCRFRGDMGDGSPYRHITFAEETGLIWQFDLAMAKKVIEWLGASNDRSKYSVAVNVSGNSVGTFAYVNELHKLLKKNLWTRGRLLFEITESARMTDLDSANRFIQSLRTEGYEVSLDDFGAGAASFQYLSTLDVDVVKLDGSAVKNAQRAAKGEAFLTALTKLCNSLNVETIAEMVDSKRTLDFVRKCGVQYVQGYLFGKPSKKVEDFEPLPQGQLFGHTKRAAR